MDRQTVKIHEKDKVGEVHIADEVIAIIAGLAATEVEGVAGMVGNFTGDLVEMLGKKNLAKGVLVDVGEKDVSLELSLIVDFGSSIPEVTNNVQEKVKNAVETMTGLEVDEINIRVAGVNVEKSK
ncbi:MULTISPECIES: Asp23/Gls24 family envelope stress response protein [Vallitalea]|uniref:Asp23/Gls24 family envelope stress response protein n=2 Tax=Vallitalea TaxID=1348611 RepID=A0A8J8MDP8_9FIRM|nr:Asp23/Gls24 family envelope stress response protein [Vallitalea guaymasensis]QUH31051.1 Asp23/Gls24 family envelope stress response protein [Vallitalea guaymasensis]GMQ64121.1 Asp23/Gls24 family envelope stress response protein [Vallitalea sp. AN17-2]